MSFPVLLEMQAHRFENVQTVLVQVVDMMQASPEQTRMTLLAKYSLPARLQGHISCCMAHSQIHHVTP